MVILIGGVSHTGKTYLAQQLLEKYHIPYFSLDHLKMGLIKSGNTCGFSIDDDDEIIGQQMWPLVEGVITTNIENKQHLIIEGCYLPPKSVSELKDRYPKDIVECYLGFSDRYITQHFEDQILRHRDVIERRLHQENRSARDFMAEHSRMRAACKQHKLHFFDVEQSYQVALMSVLKSLEKRLSGIFG